MFASLKFQPENFLISSLCLLVGFAISVVGIIRLKSLYRVLAVINTILFSLLIAYLFLFLWVFVTGPGLSPSFSF
jgi:hypothetical protein